MNLASRIRPGMGPRRFSRGDLVLSASRGAGVHLQEGAPTQLSIGAGA
jgi:hypothetical protein